MAVCRDELIDVLEQVVWYLLPNQRQFWIGVHDADSIAS